MGLVRHPRKVPGTIAMTASSSSFVAVIPAPAVVVSLRSGLCPRGNPVPE